MSFLILILLSNVPAHQTSIQDLNENMKVVFLPLYTTSLIIIQPMDQGVVATFMAYYLPITFANLVKSTENNQMTVKEFWKVFTIRDAPCNVEESWKEVIRSCMNGVWGQTLPSVCSPLQGFQCE